MKHMLMGTMIAAVLMFSRASRAEELLQEPMQRMDLSTAAAGCYVDTPAWDVATPNWCESTSGAAKTTVVFSVLGIDQSSGRYTIQYLDNTCASISYTVSEGRICLRPIRHFQSLTQRVQVTDTTTGQSRIMSATASYRPYL